MSLTGILGEWVGHKLHTNAVSDVSDAKSEARAGDFRLDVTSRVAYLGEQRLLLNSAEFDLLRFLMAHRKMLVTPQTVLSTACDSLNVRRTDFMRNLLSLKSKLDEAAGHHRYLHIEPWVLYEFDAAAGEIR